MMPKISVIMPFYNCEKFLDQAIQSILAQTFSDFEFIIINDASTDDSDKIVKKYLADSRIVYIVNKENQKITKNLNLGIELAKAEIIARMDGDDVSEKNRLEKQFIFLKENPEISLVGSFAKLIDENGKVTGIMKKPLNNEQIKRDLFLYSPFIHPSVMFQKKVWQLLGKYDERYSLGQDYELWFRWLFSQNKTANLPLNLIEYRFHSGSSYKNSREVARNTFQIRIEALKKGWGRKKIRNWFFMYLHFLLGMFFSGKIKQFLEKQYKRIFYEK